MASSNEYGICRPQYADVTPKERLNPGFPALGGQLPDSLDSLVAADINIRYIQSEMRRLERSIAHVFDSWVQPLDDTHPICVMLETLLLQVTEDNLPIIHSILVEVPKPLAFWTTAVVRDSREQLQYSYACNVSLLYLCHSMLQLGPSALDDEKVASIRKWFKQAKGHVELVDRTRPVLKPVTHAEGQAVAEGSHKRKASKGFGQKILAKLGGSKHD